MPQKQKRRGGRGGRPSDANAQIQRNQPPPTQGTGEPRQRRLPNPLLQLLTRRDARTKRSTLTTDADLSRVLEQMGPHFDQPHMRPARDFLSAMVEPLHAAGIPNTSHLGLLRFRDAPEEDEEQSGGEEEKEHADDDRQAADEGYELGSYDPSSRDIRLMVPESRFANELEQVGGGSRQDNLGEVGVHEFTHAFDFGMVRNRDYRQQALAGLAQALPNPDLRRQSVDQIAQTSQRMLRVGGRLDPHIELTQTQNVFRQSHEPLLTELMANFSELASSDDPVGHLLRRPGMQAGDPDTAADYDLLMQHAIVPYAVGVANDETLPRGIRNFYTHALMTVPTDGQSVVQEIQRRRDEVAPVLMRVMAGLGPTREMLQERLRTRLRAMQDARRARS